MWKSLKVLDRGVTHARLPQERGRRSPETRNNCSNISPSLTQTHHGNIYAPQVPIIPRRQRVPLNQLAAAFTTPRSQHSIAQ